ncbi:hypothetical protein M433DRAFT_75471 [Acidomyces richmondensis BFW]|nr:MAG: hypothetical protein FE78DRAFT_140206 [Acidomyces sp. 'richmondensis']KYG41623.1 hypothetical protein M433DRAFT_75471 [Acidomyces richmondensis BFW]
MESADDLVKQHGFLPGFLLFWWHRLQPLFLKVDTPGIRAFVWGVGVSYLLYTATRLISFVWTFVRPSTLNAYCHSPTGSWALVTGASDGIGLGFSQELLENGFNVLLHGRNAEKLGRVKEQLQQEFPRRTVEFVVADASRYDHPERVVAEKAKTLPGKLTVLVNNVGGVTTKPQFLTVAEIPSADIDTQINVNARFPLQLTHELLPVLQAHQPALVVNCGSAGGVAGSPYIVTYTSTKAFIHTFTMGLKAEMAAEGLRPVWKPHPAGIEVKGFIIGNVRSQANTSEMPFFTEDARVAARGCLARVGGSQALQFATFRQALQLSVLTNLPGNLVERGLVAEMTKRKKAQDKMR